MLMTHYRQPIDWTVDRLVDARRNLKDWIDLAYGAEPETIEPPREIVDALCDDLNTASVVSVLHGFAKEARLSNLDAARKLSSALRFLNIWSGEETNDIYSYGYTVSSGPSRHDIEPLIAARSAARARKDWKESDRIRDELAAMGVAIKDSKEGTTWEIVR
jgi:cysteinyl-tRNA synthetase